jgi:hypothetical protein
MAGLAAYGDLTPLLEGGEPVQLSHWLESVKILPHVGANEPQHYGPITRVAMSIAEQNAPVHRKHIFALAVTASEAAEFTENARRGLLGQRELQLAQQLFEFVLGLGVTGEDDLPPVGRWQMDVDHLHGGELLEHGAGRQAGSQVAQAARQGDVQAVGEVGIG